MLVTGAGAKYESNRRVQFVYGPEHREDLVGFGDSLAIVQAGFPAIAVVLSTDASSLQPSTDYRFEHGLHRTPPPQISRTCSEMRVRLKPGHENPSKL